VGYSVVTVCVCVCVCVRACVCACVCCVCAEFRYFGAVYIYFGHASTGLSLQPDYTING
jgi:hypothetical protein